MLFEQATLFLNNNQGLDTFEPLDEGQPGLGPHHHQRRGQRIGLHAGRSENGHADYAVRHRFPAPRIDHVRPAAPAVDKEAPVVAACGQSPSVKMNSLIQLVVVHVRFRPLNAHAPGPAVTMRPTA